MSRQLALQMKPEIIEAFRWDTGRGLLAWLLLICIVCGTPVGLVVLPLLMLPLLCLLIGLLALMTFGVFIVLTMPIYWLAEWAIRRSQISVFNCPLLRRIGAAIKRQYEPKHTGIQSANWRGWL
jgi:hypothetical protein